MTHIWTEWGYLHFFSFFFSLNVDYSTHDPQLVEFTVAELQTQRASCKVIYVFDGGRVDTPIPMQSSKGQLYQRKKNCKP